MSLRIVVCGAGTTGAHVARVLAEVHDVTVVDRADRVRPPRGARHVHGDATDPTVLLRAGAAEADVVVCATRHDPANLLIARLAKRRFGVRWTVARVADPAHRWLFTAEGGVDLVVSSAELVARVVQEEVTAGDLVTLLRLRGGVAVTETEVPAGAAAAGTPVRELALPPGVAITAIVRRDHVLLADRAGRLRAGDVVVALCEPGREHLLEELLTRPAACANHAPRNP
jgi:trk system potassium uptake protein TrkA